jgi:hypothetical protein
MSNPTVPNSNQPFVDTAGKITQVWQLFLNALVGPVGPIITVAVGASPFAYKANANGSVAIVGGTISAVTLTRAGVVVALGTTRLVTVAQGDVVTVTYSAAPTMNFIPS